MTADSNFHCFVVLSAAGIKPRTSYIKADAQLFDQHPPTPFTLFYNQRPV